MTRTIMHTSNVMQRKLMHQYCEIFTMKRILYRTLNESKFPVFLVLQERSTIQDLTITIEEDMCLLTLEWSEAIVSCDGISVNYSLTVTPDVENGAAFDIYSGAENRYTYIVNGSVGLQYSFNLTTEICGGQNFTMSRLVNLSGTYYLQ